MTTPAAPVVMPLYQGEDWQRSLRYYSDTAKAVPLVFTAPFMQIRRGSRIYVTLGDTDTSDGDLLIPEDGLLVMSIPHAVTPTIPKGTYDIDIFADVNGVRLAITKVGYVQIQVTARSTVDPA